MSGRGDNNKRGSSGQGNSNQSNQGFNDASATPKSNNDKHATGGTPSKPQKKEQDQASNRDHSTDGGQD
jgi:hypothetical protein